MKLLLFLTLAAMLSGCTHSELDYAMANYSCKDRGGVYKIHYTSNKQIQCNDGSYHDFIDEIPDPDYWVGSEKEFIE